MALNSFGQQFLSQILRIFEKQVGSQTVSFIAHNSHALHHIVSVDIIMLVIHTQNDEFKIHTY